MNPSNERSPGGITRRKAIKISGLALGGLALGAGSGISAKKVLPDDECTCTCPDAPQCDYSDVDADTREYSYFTQLDPFHPFDSSTKTSIARLGENEMRITFMGSSIPPNLRRVQQMMSIFVEVGWSQDKQMPLDQFVFDCGSGVCTNYAAMNVGFGRMNKIFLTHLHGDHMSDLTHIYCFGPSADRKSPLYVWGQGPSGVKSPRPPRRLYDDGTKAFCKNLREACRWHTESFSFQTTSYPESVLPLPTRESWGLPVDPVPVGDDPPNDGFALVPIELDWTKYGQVPGDNVAYHNRDTGAKITHFPVIHTRRGSMGYKLEWKNPNDPNAPLLSMIFTGDTKPEIRSRDQAINGGKGVDVFIHEMIVPAQEWASKIRHSDVLLSFSDPLVENLTTVQNSSHSPQGAFGYLLSQITPRPRLTVATHFPVADDTVRCAMNSIQQHCPVVQGNVTPTEGVARITWSFDHMVIRVTRDQIVEQQGVVSDFEFSPAVLLPQGTPNTPKYHDASGNGDPYAQIDRSTEIPACDCEEDTCNFREDGY